jgi:hypothetical protein
MLTLRRRMVGGTDAAALAGAQSCARERPWEAQSQADGLAASNQSNVVPVAFSTEGCGTQSSGTVHVAYKAPLELDFAPVLGFPDTTEVAASATAEWGPAGGLSVLPIVISLDDQRRIPCVYKAVGSTCNYFFDNNESSFHDSSNWGFGNLDQWNVDAGASCPNSGTNERRDWIMGGGPPVAIDLRGHSLVCADSGHSTSSWFSALQSLVGTIGYFPVNDPALEVTTSGREKYAIIGFTALKIEKVLAGNDPEATGTPGGSGSCSASMSMNPGTTVYLNTLSGQGCPRGAATDSISGLTLSDKTKGKTVTFQQGVDYDYDAAAHVVTWRAAAQSTVDIAFDWGQTGTPGACGLRRSDPNGVCLVASWQGVQVGGTRPGGGRDFGVRAIRLSD